MTGLKEEFDNVFIAIKKNVDDSIINNKEEISKLLVKLEIIKKCQDNLTSNCVEVIEEVENDLLNGILFMTQAFYRNSFMCLRSAMELGLSFIYYTDRNYEFLLWKHNCIDMTWSKLIDSENGVMSKKYLQLFCNRDLKVEDLSNDIKKCYHKCSEYVHGKYNFMQSINEINIKYSKKLSNEYIEKANEVFDYIIVLLFIRFGKSNNYKEKLNEYIEYWKGPIRKYGGSFNE